MHVPGQNEETHIMLYSLPLNAIFGILGSWCGFVAWLDAKVFLLLGVCYHLAPTLACIGLMSTYQSRTLGFRDSY